jgi:hypothetical protein
MKGFGGREGIRTPDPLLAKQVLSQLSYTPTVETCSYFRAFPAGPKSLPLHSHSIVPSSPAPVSVCTARLCNSSSPLGQRAVQMHVSSVHEQVLTRYVIRLLREQE